MGKSKKTNVKMESTTEELSTDQLLEIFTRTAKYHQRPIVVITMGIPGSGKSTVVKKIIEKNLNKIIPAPTKYKFSDFVNCNPDEFLSYIKEDTQKTLLAKASRKNAAILKKIRESPQKYSVIYDGTGANLSAYKGNINKFIQQGYFTILIYVKTNPLVAKNRVKKRTRKVKSEDIQRIFEDLDEPIKGPKQIKKFDFYKEMVLGNEGVYIVVDNTFRSKIIETNVSGLSI